MEVHHHAHHSGKKTWKAYFFEFFMLFFAVFCGFLAEYQLEHTVEHNKEKQFIHSLAEDLQSDTAQLTILAASMKKENKIMDSLLIELSGKEIYQNSGRASYLWIQSMGFPDFIYNDRTIQQLKSSGSLRLIRNQKVSSAIMKYDAVVRALFIHQGIMNQFIVNKDLYTRLFDFIGFRNNNGKPVPLPAESKKLLNEAYANRVIWSIYLQTLVYRFANVREEADTLIAIVKKEYSLD